MSYKHKKLKKRERHNLILLSLILVYVFFLSPFPPSKGRSILYSLILTGIFIITVYALKKKNNIFFYLIGFLIVLEWGSDFYKLTIIQWLTASLTLVFFILAIVFMMIRIAQSRKVGPLEFLEAVNVYFLLGVLGSVLFNTISRFSPAAFHFPEGITASRSDFIYYSFVTISTLGYGDIIPVSPLAKNMSILLSISGQLYLAMIVALLVGKYLSSSSKSS